MDAKESVEKDLTFEFEQQSRQEPSIAERVPDIMDKLEGCTFTLSASTNTEDERGILINPCVAHCSQSGQSTDYSSNGELRSVQGHPHEETFPRHAKEESCLAEGFERLRHHQAREATLPHDESGTGRRRENAHEKRHISRPPLEIVPVAIFFPTYWLHLRYELSLCVRFWSADLHYRDWRQVFGACYFPNFLNPAQLFVLRIALALIAFGVELAAHIDGISAFGWPIFLYFTNANASMILIYFVLISVLSFRAVRSFHNPLYSNVLDGTDTFEPKQDSLSVKDIVDLSEARKSQVTLLEQQVNRLSSNEASSFAGNKFSSSVSTNSGQRCLRAKRALEVPGYTDLLADPMFCVDGIILAPNPSYPKAQKCCGAACPRRQRSANTAAGVPEDVEESDMLYRTEAPFLVNFTWVLHSAQLVGSLSVMVFFFSFFRMNETHFPETWYSVWRHIVIICCTLIHSLILSRIPFPIRHTIFVLVLAFSYLFLQVLVFILDLSNGDGDTGCVYRVLNLKYPLSAALICFMGLAGVLLFTLTYWSILRGRLLLVDPPPAVSVPASRVEEVKVKQAISPGSPRSKFYFCCLPNSIFGTSKAIATPPPS